MGWIQVYHIKTTIAQVSENEIITNFRMFKNVELHKKWKLLTMTHVLNCLVNCQYNVIMIKFDLFRDDRQIYSFTKVNNVFRKRIQV